MIRMFIIMISHHILVRDSTFNTNGEPIFQLLDIYFPHRIQKENRLNHVLVVVVIIASIRHGTALFAVLFDR